MKDEIARAKIKAERKAKRKNKKRQHKSEGVMRRAELERQELLAIGVDCPAQLLVKAALKAEQRRKTKHNANKQRFQKG